MIEIHQRKRGAADSINHIQLFADRSDQSGFPGTEITFKGDNSRRGYMLNDKVSNLIYLIQLEISFEQLPRLRR